MDRQNKFNVLFILRLGLHIVLPNGTDIHKMESHLCFRFFDKIKPSHWENVEINAFKEKLKTLGD